MPLLVGIAAVWTIIFHPPFSAPFTILFFARDVPFAQRIIHCNRDWSPKRRLSKPFELLYGLEKTSETTLGFLKDIFN